MGSSLSALQHEVLGCFLRPGCFCLQRPPAALHRLPLRCPHRPGRPHRGQEDPHLQDPGFEPVEADTPADAKLITLKETEHSYDVLVPGPTKYISTPVAYPHALGYAGLGLPYYGLPLAVAAPAAEEAAEE